MAKPLMSDAEIRRRKKLQSHISMATGTLGLAALTGTAVASRPGRKALRMIPKVDRVLKKPPPRDPKRDRIKSVITPTLATSAGLGGVGAFNFASYTGAESRKRAAMQPKKPVSKRDEMAPVFGEVAKAWSPTANTYDPEANRLKRNRATQTGLNVAGGASIGGAALVAHKGVQTRREGAALKKVKPVKPAKVKTVAAKFPEKAGSVKYAARKTQQLKTEAQKTAHAATEANKLKATKTLARGTKQLVRAGKYGAGGAALLGAGEYVRRQRKSRSWEPYAKRDSVSAFGVDHADEVEKALTVTGAIFSQGFKGKPRKPGKPPLRPIGKAINIKPENEGKFTASAKKAKEGVQEHAHAVVNSSKSSELQRKRAQFAINAKKWHHG